ncbi:MAG: septum formation initiator family protein [bacterium]|nr:septum formation initiator family protein [bacterium]
MARSRRKPERIRWALLAAPLIALVAAFATLVLDRENGLVSLIVLQERVRTTDERVFELKTERVKLAEQARRLRFDPLEIETVARGVLGMVRPDEVVVQLNEDVAAAP